MATQTVVSDHPTSHEQVKQEAQEEVKACVGEIVTPTKGSEEVEKPKAEDSPSPVVPFPESMEKIEDKLIEPDVIEEMKKTKEEEKPKADDFPSPAVPLDESEEKIKDKQIELPLVDEVKEKPKTEEFLTPPGNSVESGENIEDKQIDLPVIEEVKKTEEEEKPKAEGSPCPSVLLVESEENIEDKPPLVEEVKHIEEKAEDSATEAVPLTEEIKVEDKEIEPKASEPAVNIVQSQPEEGMVIKTTENTNDEEQTAESDDENPIELPKIDDVPESLIKAVEKKNEPVEDLPVKESEPTALVQDAGDSKAESKNEEVSEPLEESIVVEPKKSLEVKIAKSEEGSADKVDDSKLLKEEGLSEVTLTNDKNPVEPKEAPLASITQIASMVDKEKELSVGPDLVEGLTKQEAVELEKAENEAKNSKKEELSPLKTKEVEEVTSSISNTEAAEKTLEGEITSREFESVAENGKDDTKCGTATSVETVSTGAVEEKTTPEPDETKLENPRAETKPEKEKEDGDTEKPEIPVTDIKEADETKTTADLPKEEVTIIKSTQKQSNNILSKVKHTLVKAKKAIIGKSPNSKTPSSETKGEVKA